MAQHFHAVVCIDHAETIVYAFADADVTEHRIAGRRCRPAFAG